VYLTLALPYLFLRLLRIRHKSSETDLFGAEKAGFRVEMMDCADRRYGDLTLPQVKPPKDRPVQRCYGKSPMRVVLACRLRSPILSRSLPFISIVATHRNHQEVFEQGKFGANRSADPSISEFLVNTTTAANVTRPRPLLAYLPRRFVIFRYIPASNVARSDEQICLQPSLVPVVRCCDEEGVKAMLQPLTTSDWNPCVSNLTACSRLTGLCQCMEI